VVDEAIAAADAWAICITNSKTQHSMSDPAKADDMGTHTRTFRRVQEEYQHWAVRSRGPGREVLHGLASRRLD